MEKALPDIILGSAPGFSPSTLSRLVRAGRLRKLHPGVYSSDLEAPADAVIARHLYQVLGYLFPGALLSHRSALEGGPASDGTIFLTYSYTRKIQLPGLVVRLLEGPGPLESDKSFLGGLFIASRPRAFLENLQPARRRGTVAKSLSAERLERRLDRLCQASGEEGLNRLRDEARQVAGQLDMEREFRRLDGLIGALLRTRPADSLGTEVGRARARSAPYDQGRLDIFQLLFRHLRQEELPWINERPSTPGERQVLAFFESYFSNYIEGTVFEIEVARQIIFDGKIPARRPADAHDISGTFRVVADSQEMSRTAASAEAFFELLRSRHRTIMAGRPEAGPGEFKDDANRAGGTHFVAPELVNGTLAAGFEVFQGLDQPLARALFMMFLVAEVHPFSDGNGRLARVMMNVELVAAGLCRIIVPTVFRDDYLLALRAMSRKQNPKPLLRALGRAQRFTAELDLSSFDAAVDVMQRCGAFLESDEGRLLLPSEL